MKFDYKRTCLDFLTPNAKLDFDFYVDKKGWDAVRKKQLSDELKLIVFAGREYYLEKIQYITKPFYEAFISHRLKIAEVLKSELVPPSSGTFIIHCGEGVVKTIFYTIENHEIGKYDATIMEFTKSRENDIVACSSCVQVQLDGKIMAYIGEGYYRSPDFMSLIGNNPNESKAASVIFYEFCHLVAFLKYCDTETKIIQPKERYRDDHKNKYINETNLPVEILDSRWFTTIVRSEGFGVRGHLRLQPYGPGRSMKRWIYIEDYEKSGYTIKSKIQQ